MNCGGVSQERAPYHSLSTLPPPRSFQLTVEMFDYMDCELKLSESGEPRGIGCGNLETLGTRGASVS